MIEYRSGKIIAKLEKTEKTLINDINFCIGDGCSLALVGETGAGKTTIASAIMGIISENIYIDSDSFVLDGKALSLEERRRAMGEKIVYIPQSGHECLNKTRKIKHQFADSNKKMIASHKEILSMVGFNNAEAILEMYPFELSGGMAQRVVIAMAACANPRLVIADEPTNGIDESFAKEFIPLLNSIFPKASKLIITHDINLAKSCDGILHIQKGERAAKEDYLKSVLNDNQYTGTSSISIHNTTNELLLKCEKLSKTFGSKTVLTDASLEIPGNSIVGLLGQSGIGKSSLAKIITGLEMPDHGQVYYNGKALYNHGHFDRKTALAIQMVYQQPYAVLDPSQKIRNGLRELIKYHNISYEENIDCFIDAMAAKLNLSGEILNHLPIQISGGEAQRAAILKCLLLKPKLLILDEATSMLDELTQQEILNFIKNEMKKNEGSILMISHNEKMAEEYCDKIFLLNEGIISEKL